MMGILYGLMRFSYEKVYGEQQMLHYPLQGNGRETLLEGQKRFTDYCLSQVPGLSRMRVLDIGCGNGIQTLHIHEKYRPDYIYGVDLSPMHIELAREKLASSGASGVDFAVDNAQVLASVDDGSFDVAICIESSHHYPDKDAFLNQVQRVLRPGGYFVLADLMRRNHRESNLVERKMSLSHWHPQRYKEAFRRIGMTVVEEENITGLILPAFQSTGHWLERPSTVGPMAHAFGKPMGLALIAFYKVQLKHLPYLLFVARKD